jgi:hypothetical protein
MPGFAKWLLVLSALALPVVLWACGVFSEPPAPAIPVSDHDVIHFSKELAKTFLRSPETAVFPEDDQFTVTHLGGLRWHVSGYADVDTGLRKTVRVPLAIEVEKHPGRWKLIKRDVILNEQTKQIRDESWTKRLQRD